MFGRLNKFFSSCEILYVFLVMWDTLEINFSLLSIYITCKVSKVFNKQSGEASISISPINPLTPRVSGD